MRLSSSSRGTWPNGFGFEEKSKYGRWSVCMALKTRFQQICHRRYFNKNVKLKLFRVNGLSVGKRSSQLLQASQTPVSATMVGVLRPDTVRSEDPPLTYWLGISGCLDWKAGLHCGSCQFNPLLGAEQ